MPRPKSDRKMEKIVISITEPQKEWLEGEADRLGISPAEFIRRVLDVHRGVGLSGRPPQVLAALPQGQEDTNEYCGLVLSDGQICGKLANYITYQGPRCKDHFEYSEFVNTTKHYKEAIFPEKKDSQ